MVWLTDAADVAGDGRWTAPVHIRALCALGVQRFALAGADDLHGCGNCRQIPIVFLLFHLPYFDVSARH